VKSVTRFFIILLICTAAGQAQNLSQPENELRIESLLNQMTLEEKIGQLHLMTWVNDTSRQQTRDGQIGAFMNIRNASVSNELQRIAVEESRLKIPLLFGNDVIHGFRTIFPIPLGEAASWDPDLAERTAAIAAREAAASGTNWTFAPMVDVARDPRWGRIAEGAGEDPYLGSVFAAVRVRGFQGDNLSDPLTIVACPKHYVAYGAAQAGRDYNTVDISLQTLRDIYLPPFQAAVAAGAGTIMSAFNEINGVPASANPLTLTQILRNEWGFQGFVVSDWESIYELFDHGIGVDVADVGQQALLAGVEMDMMGFVYPRHLGRLVQQGQLDEKVIDEAVRRVLRIKFAIGLFERPFVDLSLEKSEILTPANLAVALESARKSIVLLKNEKQILPLSKKIKSVALIGPLADNAQDPLGCWHCEGKAADVVTVRAGIQAKLPAAKITFAPGCGISDGTEADISRAVALAKKAEVAILVVGESLNISGEAASRSSIDLPGIQEKLVKAVFETGTPTVVVLMSGRPLTIPWLAEKMPAILATWQLGLQSVHAIADVLFGDFNPGGKTPVTWPRVLGQVPIFYNHKNTGRPPRDDDYFTSKYLDVPVTPLFPFGFGLSYTQFQFSDLKVTVEKIGGGQQIRASVIVQNQGTRAGDEVVQLYVQDVVGSLTRPVKELKRFRRITLLPNEKTPVDFQLDARELGFYNQNLDYVVEPGLFRIWIGPNSVEGLAGSFTLEKTE